MWAWNHPLKTAMLTPMTSSHTHWEYRQHKLFMYRVSMLQIVTRHKVLYSDEDTYTMMTSGDLKL